jgi:hypothetical protein
MRAEVFLKNGRKITVDNVISVHKLKQSYDKLGLICIDYEKSFNGGEFTTCDEPSMGFEAANVDMIKLVGFE